jgi:hypothetical protein
VKDVGTTGDTHDRGGWDIRSRGCGSGCTISFVAYGAGGGVRREVRVWEWASAGGEEGRDVG